MHNIPVSLVIKLDLDNYIVFSVLIIDTFVN